MVENGAVIGKSKAPEEMDILDPITKEAPAGARIVLIAMGAYTKLEELSGVFGKGEPVVNQSKDICWAIYGPGKNSSEEAV